MMIKLLSTLAIVAALAACAANPSEMSPGAERAPPPPLAAPAGEQPSVAAPGVSITPAPPPAPRASDDEVVVHGQSDTQTPAPAGDPRTVSERMEDIHAWDECVTRAQAAGESDPMRPQLSSPEETCARGLAMARRNSVPFNRVRLQR